MADFKTHLSIGSAVGFLLATFSYVWHWVESITMAITVFLVTSVASFLPDMDSDSGLPVKIIFTVYGYLVAGVIIFYTYQSVGLVPSLLFAAAGFWTVYAVVARIFQKYTRHRGIFHSIPAALLAFFLSLLLTNATNLEYSAKFALSLGAFTGYLTHLILDEIWGLKYITDEEGRMHLTRKKSFGTALDFGFSGNQSNTSGLIAWALVFILFLVTLPTIKKIYFAFLQ